MRWVGAMALRLAHSVSGLQLMYTMRSNSCKRGFRVYVCVRVCVCVCVCVHVCRLVTKP